MVRGLWQARYQIFVVNLVEEMHKIKSEGFNCFFEFESAYDGLINYECLSCNKNYSEKIDKNFKNRFKNKLNFWIISINFILLLRKGVYPYEYMDDWEKINKTSLPGREEFYCNLNVEKIRDWDYNNARRICKDSEIKCLGEYQDLYLKNHTLLLADVFENILEKCA